MFKAEANMMKPVLQWMQSLNLAVKSEFITPWGMCDLVGVGFRKGNVKRRQKLRQTRAINSMRRAALLHRIPDAATHASITLQRLARECASIIPRDVVFQETQRLVTDRFIQRLSGDRLQRLNGWMPLHKRLMAVELKLKRVEEALWQARNNLAFANESYVALPEQLASRVADKPSRWEAFLNDGVGILAVTPSSCDILIRSQQPPSMLDNVVQFYCIEKFWRTHLKAVEH